MSDRTPSPYGEEPMAPRPEAEIPTPPRGLRVGSGTVPAAVPEPRPDEIWQRPAPPTAPPRRVSRGRVLQVVALVIGLVGTAWVSTDHLRTVWPGAAPREPVAVGSAGEATLAGIVVSLVEAIDLGATPSLPGSDWQPPDGFHAWRVVLETSSTNADVFTCDVAIVDDRGRQFLANHFVDSFVDGYVWSYTCGEVEPEDEVGPQQAMLVLVPADAEVRTVRIWSTSLNPDFIELEI